MSPRDDEESLRSLQAEREGVAPGRQVEFMGEKFGVAEAPLVPLLRYVSIPKGARDVTQMSYAHRLLEESLAPECWAQFQDAAFTNKASGDDISKVVHRIAEIHGARPWRPVLRLLGYVATNFTELDGTLINQTGRGLGSLSVRQICNLVYARMLAGKEEDARDEWIEDLYLDFDPEDEARKKVMQMIADREAQA